MLAHQARLLHHIHRLLNSHGGDGQADADLLARYVHKRDEAAFAALVGRHGPMVLNLCRRLIGDGHAAEDAFQATFLVLARRAHAIRRPAALAAWLYGAARRIAWKMRAGVGRTRAFADPLIPDCRPDPLSELSAREVLLLLDEELRRLPEPYRLAVVLCNLDGKSYEEAAGVLGCTVGALRGRLERGRRRLHERLVRRGLTLSAALALADVAGTGASAGAVSTLLAGATASTKRKSGGFVLLMRRYAQRAAGLVPAVRTARQGRRYTRRGQAA